MQIIIIAALSDNYVIGINNKLPWYLPADLKHFRELTFKKPVIMGRKTYDSIGKVLPGRRNIVLSKNKNIRKDCEVYSSLEEALFATEDCSEVFIIGGAKIYEQALSRATKMYLTLVHRNFVGDTYFPKWNVNEWKTVERQDFEPDKDNIYAYSFLVLERVM